MDLSGGPAALSGQIKAGDRLISVDQVALCIYIIKNTIIKINK